MTTPATFEPTTTACEEPQTHALDRAATGDGYEVHFLFQILILLLLEPFTLVSNYWRFREMYCWGCNCLPENGGVVYFITVDNCLTAYSSKTTV